MVKRTILACGVIVILGWCVATSAADEGDGSFSVESFFDVFTELSVAPGEILGINLQARRLDSGELRNVAALNLSSPPVEDVYLLGEVPGASTAPPTMRVFATSPPPSGGSIDSFFDVFVDIEIPPSPAAGEPKLAARPVIRPGGIGFDSFFDVFVDIEIPDTPPAQRILRLRLRCAAGQAGVIVKDVRLNDNLNMVESFFDVFVELAMPSGEGFDPALPATVFDLAGRFRPALDTLGGDADLDGDVDLDDFVILKTHFGLAGAAWTDGDFNTDMRVNLDDFIILKNNFGRTH